MKSLYKNISVVVFFFFLSVFTNMLYAQTKAYFKAEKLFNAGAYFDAEMSYREAYNSISEKTNKGDILFKMAECYRLVNNPKKAEMWYVKAVNKKTTFTLSYYYLAEMQKMNEKYEDAKESYKKYKELEPNDLRADEGVKSCEMAQKWIDNPNGYVVDNIKFFNSKFSDYTPAYASADNSTVFFTSHREGQFNKSKNPVTGEPNGHIYVSKMDKKGAWSEPTLLTGTVNDDNEAGSPNLSKDFKTLYFNRSDKLNKLTLANHIYSCTVQGEDYWDPCKKIEMGSDSLSFGCPAISSDNLTLYFSSRDLKGGIGNSDIWKVTRKNNAEPWGQPENLGPQINSKGDEGYPYVHADGTLYFSSNGLNGMGGLDFFKAKIQLDGTWKVENMGYPMNSSADDFGITFQQDQEKGFFSSCRGKGDADIYQFVLPPLRFNVIGVVRDEKTDLPLAESTIKTISSDGITSESKTDKNGVFRLPLKLNTDYIFIASSKGYLNGKHRETTKGLNASKDLKPVIKLASYEKPIELPNIAYDFAKWDLRPESKTALDKLVETLNDNPTIIIELMSHTDSRGSEGDNLNLSQKRAQSVVDYLTSKGIVAERLQAKGYGESSPKIVNKKIAETNSFLKEDALLNEMYINLIGDADLQEIAHQLNRRTEFKVLSADFKAKK